MTTFNLKLSPVRGDTPITLEKQGNTLIVDGETFDFAFLSDGDILPKDAVSGDWLASDVVRVDGVLHLTVSMPHGQNAPHETCFPEPITATKDGPIDLPPYDTQEEGA